MDYVWHNIKEKGSEISAQSSFAQAFYFLFISGLNILDSICVHLTSYQEIALLHFKVILQENFTEILRMKLGQDHTADPGSGALGRRTGTVRPGQ